MTAGIALKDWTPPVVLALVVTLGCGRRPAPASAAVTVAVPFELSTLDPHAEDKLSSLALLANIYEPLVGTDADMGLRPALARAWESPEPLTWVFHLRSDVRFQSGKPLRAGDVVYSFERIIRSRGLEIRNYLVDVEDVTRVDDQTVRIRTRVPTRILLNRFAHVFVVPEGEGEERLGASADGTGPYALASGRGTRAFGWSATRATGEHRRQSGRRPSSWASEAAREVRDDLERIGILAELRVLPNAEFFELVRRRGATIWLNRFGCLTGDGTEWLNDLVHSVDPERHLGTINYGGYSDRELDRAIEGIARIEKLEERRTAIQELVGKTMERLVVIPLYNNVDIYAVDRSLSWRPRTDSYILAAEIAPWQ